MEIEYCKFFISTETENILFVNEDVIKQFKSACVYGEKTVTIDSAIKNDGRFINLENYKLKDLESSTIFDCTERVERVHNKLLEIIFPISTEFKIQDVNTLEIFDSDIYVEEVTGRTLRILR